MWIESKPSWIRLVFSWRGSVIRRIWPRIAVVTGLALAVAIAREVDPDVRIDITTAPLVVLGLPLGIFLGFRNGAAYDRFWEGRKMWGLCTNLARTFTRQVFTLIDDDDVARRDAVRRELVGHVIVYAHALRRFLRRETPIVDRAEDLVDEDERAALAHERNPPIAILHRLGERLAELRREGRIHPMHAPVFEQSLTALTDVQGACERIVQTPIPFSYNVLMHRMVALYCLLLPWGLVATLKWGAPFVAAIVSYAFFGFDAIADELENPFGYDTNDLPLTVITTGIEADLRQRLGDEKPASEVPRSGLLT